MKLNHKEFEDTNDLVFFVNFYHIARENIQQILATEVTMHPGTALEHKEYRITLLYWE